MATSRPEGSRRRLVPIAVWVGCMALAGLAGASWSVSPSNSQTVPTPQPSAAAIASRVVCIGHVDVEAGTVSLYPLQPGRVKKVLVHENSEVAADARLFEMDDTLARCQVAEARADLGAAEADLELARQLIPQHEAGIEAQKAAIEARRQELSAAKHRYERARRLSDGKDHIGSADDTKLANDAVKAVEAAIDAEKAKLHGLEASSPKTAVAKAEVQIKAKKAQLEKAEYGLKECTVRAPCKGKVLRLQLSEGEMLGSAPHYPVLQFCPDGPRIIRAEVEQEFAERLSRNQIAKIHDDSTGEQHWTGKVARISDWFTHRRSIIQEPLHFNDVRTLECIITVDPNGPPLRIGQRVRVTLENAS